MNKTATIEISQSALEKGVVILALDAYKNLQKKIIPTHYFSGKKAENIDKLVKDGLKEHKAGNTIKASSLKDALKVYGN